ncbi:unnamed protein product [Dicrocoelium dendriticum]|nr:unnamed protein product [Dicrocoelium dendriticum]
MGFCARFPKSTVLSSSLTALRDVLERAIDRLSNSTGASASALHDASLEAYNKVPDVSSLLCQLEEDAKPWLLDSIRSVLRDSPSIGSVHAVAHLIQALTRSSRGADQEHLSSLLQDCCLRCCPRLLQHILEPRQFSTPELSAEMANVSRLCDTDGDFISDGVTTKIPLRIGDQLLFRRMQQAITEPAHVLEQLADPTLCKSVQSYLIGLGTAFLHRLSSKPQMPMTSLTSSSSPDTDIMASQFLHLLIEIILNSLGRVPRDISVYRDPRAQHHTFRRHACSVGLLHLTLCLMDYRLHRLSMQLCENATSFLESEEEQEVNFYLGFLAAIDHFGAASEPLTYWNLDHHWPAPAQSVSQGLAITNLLVPKHPTLFGSWYPSPICATAVAHFTDTSASSLSASMVFTGASECTETNSEPLSRRVLAARLAPCQVLAKCRLLRSGLSVARNSLLGSKLSVCLFGCIRLLKRTASIHPTSESPWESATDSLLNLDPHELAATISHMNAFGWTDRKQFERSWMSYLELLVGSSQMTDGHSAESPTHLSTLDGVNVELIERNQCVQTGLAGMTRLLLDAALRPEPGDPLHSELRHQPRCGTPHFSHTKLGRKLASIVSKIEGQHMRLVHLRHHYLGKSFDSYSQSGELDPVSGATMELSPDLIEPNLERLADVPGSPGPSLFAIYWIVRRLMPSTDSSGISTDDSVGDVGAPTPQLRKDGNTGRLTRKYEDLLFSCLQSIQLLCQSWAGQPSLGAFVPTAKMSPKPVTTMAIGVTDSTTTSTSDSFSLTNPSRIGVAVPQPKGLVLAVSTAVVRSLVILSDLFTTREQFEWLKLYLKEVLQRLPSPAEFPAPIHTWLTLGLAKCTAVLELVQDCPNADVLHSSSLEPAVRQTIHALQSTVIPIQDAGLQASMWLLHSAILIRTQPHQSHLQQHSPPTGSSVLNELYTQVCVFVERKLATIFGPLPPVRASSEAIRSGTLPPRRRPVGGGSMRWNQAAALGTTGLKKLMAGAFGSSISAKGGGGGAHTLYDGTESNVSPPSPVDRTERHQLTVLATAFFLTEHFSAPPVYPVLMDFGSGLTEMLSGLTCSLFKLSADMLSDATPPAAKDRPPLPCNRYALLDSGTTRSLCCPLSVHTAWCRGVGRLVLLGRLGKGATESLMKMCIARVRTCRSPLISFPVLRLLITCVYASTGRLTAQLQNYSHGSGPSSEPRTHNTASGQGDATSVIDEARALQPGDSRALPLSVLEEFESTIAVTQEFLGCLWERLRGGVAPLQSVPAIAGPLWISNAWTCIAEAVVIADLLPVTSMEIVHTLKVTLALPMGQAFDANIADPVLNKALGEFARLDHTHPHLAAQTLIQLFALFLATEGGRSVIRKWILLSLPTLLDRQPARLAIWATSVCLLAATTDPTLRLATILCADPAMFRPCETEADRPVSNQSRASNILSDLLCLSAVHFIRFGLLCNTSTGDEVQTKRRAEQQAAFLHAFEQIAQLDATSAMLSHIPHCHMDHDEQRTFQRVYRLLHREMCATHDAKTSNNIDIDVPSAI